MNKKIPFAEADKTYSFSSYLQASYDGNVDVYEGDTVFDKDLSLNDELKDGSAGMVVKGNLTVKGSIIDDSSAFLVVMGNTHAGNIIAADSEIYFDGETKVDNVIYAYYNDGTLDFVGNKVEAKIIISSDHDTRLNPKITTGIKISASSDDEIEDSDFNPDDIPNIMVPEVLAPEGYIQEGELKKYILSNKPIMKAGAKTVKERNEEMLGSALKNKDQVQEMDFTDKHIKKFPEEVLKLKNLKKLTLSGNDISELPSEISELENLEELYLDHCSLKNLPKEIGQLKKLRILDISSNFFEKIPEELGDLVALEELYIKSNKADLPKSLNKLQKLNKLILTGSDSRRLVVFPDQITELTGLKILNLSDNPFKSIPNSLVNLSNLEELNLGASLCDLSELPDLSKLKNLKKLVFPGNGGNANGSYAQQKLLEYVYPITSLEHLEIDRWGKETDRIKNEKTGKWEDVVKRGPLTSISDKIGNLVNLKTLDISLNDIEHLPESFYNLKNLEEVNLHYCDKLAWEDVEKLTKAFPKTRLILTNIPARYDTNDPTFIKVNELTKQGSNLMQAGKYTEAIALFDQAIALCKPDAKWSDYSKIYSMYGKVNSLLEMIAAEKDKTKRADLVKQAEEVEHACLDLIPESALLWHFTDEVQFKKEVVRKASNGLAWYVMERTPKTDTENLNKALEYLQRALSNITGKRDYYIYDTQVRILLKMGKNDEAYAVVTRILAENPDFADLQDIKKSPEYKKWQKDASAKKQVSIN